MRRILSLLFVALIFSAWGCGEGQKRINVAVMGRAKTQYWDDVKLGAEAAGKALGVSVKFLVPSEEDPAWQIKKIEEIIAEPVDGIAFSASDPKSIAPSVLKAMQSEIPCIALDTDAAKSRHLYIGTKNYYAGQQAGERMVSLLDSLGKVAIVSGSSADSDSLQRVRGFRDIIDEYTNISIAATLDKESGDVQTSDVEPLLASHPNLNGIFCASDSSGLAVARVVQKFNKSEQIKIVCVGESSDIMNMVRDGLIQAAIVRKPYRIGYLAVLALHNMAKVGIDNAMMIMPKSEIIDTGISIVTPLNIAQYREQLKELGIKVKF